MMETKEKNSKKDYLENLRNVQINLKRESAFETFYWRETREFNREISNIYIKVVYQAKLLSNVCMNTFTNSVLQQSPVYISSLFNIIPSSILPPNIPHNDLILIQKSIMSLYSDIPGLCKKCDSLIRKDPSNAKILAFSTIPSFFGNLWCSESADKYLQFMKEIIINYPQHSNIFSQVMYTIPLFFDFLQELSEDLDLNSEHFADTFYENWKKNAKYCPKPIIEMLSYSSNPGNLLFKSLLERMIHSPSSYRIMPYVIGKDKIDPKFYRKTLKDMSNKLWECLEIVKNEATLLPTSNNMKLFLPDYENCFMFTSIDLDLILSLAKLKIANPLPKDQFIPYLFIHPEQVPKSPVVTFPATMEGRLREMLILLNNVPECYQIIQINELLQNEIDFMPNSTIFKKKMVELSPLIKDIKMEKCIKILQENFDQRENDRKKLATEISIMNKTNRKLHMISNKIDICLNVIKKATIFILMEEWAKAENPLLNIDDSLYINESEFGHFLTQLIEKWENWCKINHYSLDPAYDEVFNYLMRAHPFEKFIQSRPDEAKADEVLYNNVKTVKEKSMEIFLAKVLDYFKENPEEKLISATKLLRSVFMIESPLYKAEKFIQTNAQINYLIQLAGEKEIGADQYTPVQFLILALENPPHLKSTIRYIKFFTSSLSSIISKKGISIPLLAKFESIVFMVKAFERYISEHV
ncbi:hypothetical protein TRFO_27386 [Tritrichomonas foetus]|uniref:VPS9 domain-containing protein n=1 Tax=Tritrichomonas foetus TaxID=1144522 RepID=A0A1J4K5P4_9EUKA|nr:hypothetical protein TRFO_27386 [Tritrichomonas foetus]|eukprot:OHT04998.1 hypothetical protein TRFO_27386 [Tritrichomonas foetus]